MTRSTADPPATGTGTEPERRLQGEAGIWIVVVADTVAFCILFGMFLLFRREQPEVFARGQAELSLLAGTVNTLILLTSSVVVVGATDALRRGLLVRAVRWFRVAGALGVLFVVAKALEWSYEVGRGLTPRTDDFFMLYFGLTGLHLFHVLIGVGVLFAAAAHLRRRRPDAVTARMLESAATFWHMVDLLWLILFPTVYLIG